MKQEAWVTLYKKTIYEHEPLSNNWNVGLNPTARRENFEHCQVGCQKICHLEKMIQVTMSKSHQIQTFNAISNYNKLYNSKLRKDRTKSTSILQRLVKLDVNNWRVSIQRHKNKNHLRPTGSPPQLIKRRATTESKQRSHNLLSWSHGLIGGPVYRFSALLEIWNFNISIVFESELARSTWPGIWFCSEQ